jgi:hypothetical protein
MENPFIVESIQAHTIIPWVGADTSYDYDARAVTYKVGENTWTKAGYEHYKWELIDWWTRESLQLIP